MPRPAGRDKDPLLPRALQWERAIQARDKPICRTGAVLPRQAKDRANQHAVACWRIPASLKPMDGYKHRPKAQHGISYMRNFAES